jgi:hypothetical protein
MSRASKTQWWNADDLARSEEQLVAISKKWDGIRRKIEEAHALTK